ncbi:MAG: 2,3-bisphosphoglycerate-independent phosphoglycerate mutase [Rhodospirillales bacterium]|nr:2,3-bisphosphoglycerate-independent phosphoglycerate mutase [Rhodospirillales bacterium]
MNGKQGLLLIADGLGDRPIPELGGRTPLEQAATPNMDFFAARGLCGNVHPYKPGIPVGTDVGHLVIFGFDPDEVYPGRGPLEAFSAGIMMGPDDIAFRGNFATVDERSHVLDRRAGRIASGTRELAAALDGMQLGGGARVLAKPLTEHRVAIVFRQAGLSTAVTPTDPNVAGHEVALPACTPTDGSAEAARTASLVNEFTTLCRQHLDPHPVNRQRRAEGKPPANVVLLRGVGRTSSVVPIGCQFKLTCACVAGDLTVLGIARLVGLETFHNKSFTGGIRSDLQAKARQAIDCVRQGFDWTVVHVKGPDLCGHDGNPLEKIRIIEDIDGMFGLFRRHLDLDRTIISLTGDHSTPCEKGDHSGDPVPTFISGPTVRRDGIAVTGESSFRTGSLSGLTARDVFRTQLDQLNVMPKRGA